MHGNGWESASPLTVAGLLALAGGVAPTQEPGYRPPASALDESKITTLDEVRALPPELEIVDLERPNPVRLEPNPFDRHWNPPPTVEEVSLQGGYIFLGINYGLYMAGNGLHRLSGGPDQVRPAVARPTPLSDQQLRRAVQHHEAEGMPGR